MGGLRDIDAVFRDDGVVVLEGAFGRDEAAFLREMIWRHIETSTRVRLADPVSWKSDENFGLRAVEQRDGGHPIQSNGPLLDALDRIFGPDGWLQPGPPQILLSFPISPPWQLPAGWHIDFGGDQPAWPVFAVKMFALLDDVGPEGGGTLLLKRSHRLVEHLSNHHAGPVDPWDRDDRPLDALPDVRDLLAGVGGRERLGKPISVNGIDLSPFEVTGSAGDIVLTHMHVFHSAAPNVSSEPRHMLGNAFRSRSPRQDTRALSSPK